MRLVQAIKAIRLPDTQREGGKFRMYAVIETGGKQYRVSAGDKLRLEKIHAEEGEQVSFGQGDPSR